MTHSTNCARSNDIPDGEWGKPYRLQKVSRNIQRIYTHRRSHHLSLPVVLPVCGWRKEPLDGNCDARFCKPVRQRYDHTLNVGFLKGGSFLYVATVLQPVSPNHTSGLPHEDDIDAKTRLISIVLGMFAPLLLSSLIGHGHS